MPQSVEHATAAPMVPGSNLGTCVSCERIEKEFKDYDIRLACASVNDGPIFKQEAAIKIASTSKYIFHLQDFCEMRNFRQNLNDLSLLLRLNSRLFCRLIYFD